MSTGFFGEGNGNPSFNYWNISGRNTPYFLSSRTATIGQTEESSYSNRRRLPAEEATRDFSSSVN